MEPDNQNPAEPKENIRGANLEYKRRPDDQFFDEYANSIFVQSGAWDVTLTFGRLEPSKGPNTVVQHSAITIPWSHVRPFIYFLKNHLISQEILNGKHPVPKGIIPNVTEPSEELIKSLPEGVAQKTYEAIKKNYEEFFEVNPEAR
ncbi:MAG TPA: hypothetical protein VG206_00235 [Terriglobia bacterium]|nr:hypothetical protein [Terriglobia bacterium]